MMRRGILLVGSLILSLTLAAQDYHDLASQAFDASQHDSLQKAEILYKQALEKDPTNRLNSMLFSNLGTVQQRMGKIDEAIQSYSLALNLAPQSVKILLNRASLYLQKDLLDKAYIDYCNVLDVDRKNEEALLYRAYIYTRRRSYKEARIDYNTLLQKLPEHRMGRLGLALLDQKEMRYREASEIFNRLLEDDPNDTSILKARANLELEMELPDMALLDVNNVIRLTPNDAEAYLMKGDIYLVLKKKKDANKAYDKAVSLGIPRPEVLNRMKEQEN